MESLNPYAPTLLSAEAAGEGLAEAKRRLARPATALIVMSSIHSVFVSIPLVSCAINAAHGQLHEGGPTLIAIYLFQLSCLIFIAVGSAKMGHLKSRVWGRFAAILACIPLISPFMIAGIPFGIWSLKLLAESNIEAAFESTETVDATGEQALPK